MSLSLSTHELEQLKNAMRALLSPFDYKDDSEWRRTVNAELRQLLNADSAGFLLPEADGLYLYSAEHDPAALSRYPDLLPPALSSGRSIFEQMATRQVATLEVCYASDFPLYLNSEYYHDYAGANGAHDTLFAMLPLHEAGIAGVQFWHEHPTRRKFGTREVGILELVFPALQSGVRTYLRLKQYRSALTQVVDQLDEAIAIYCRSGRLVHQTPQLSRLLAMDAEAWQCLSAASTANYERRSLRYNVPDGDELLIVFVERRSNRPLSDAELAARFDLTPAEIRVARAIAADKSNSEIAKALVISPHTSKRHTESIFKKLGASKRNQVAAKLRGS